MVFLRSVSFQEPEALIQGRDVVLRMPRMADYEAWAELREVSRSFLVPWEPVWPRDDLTRGAFRARVKRYVRDFREDQAYAFFIFRNDTGALAGGLTLSNVRRGVAQAGSVGYWVGAPHARRGLMKAALRAFVPYAFDTLRLNRLEAACLPVNEPSVRLLRAAGFSEEGLARRYLKISGTWQDHLLFAMLADDPRP